AKFVLRTGIARRDERPTLSDPLFDPSRSRCADTWIGRVKCRVLPQSALCDIFLRDQVDEIMVLHQRQIKTARFKHVYVIERLPQVRRETVKQRNARGSRLSWCDYRFTEFKQTRKVRHAGITAGLVGPIVL